MEGDFFFHDRDLYHRVPGKDQRPNIKDRSGPYGNDSVLFAALNQDDSKKVTQKIGPFAKKGPYTWGRQDRQAYAESAAERAELWI